MNLFKIDNPIYNILTRMVDLIILNILWVICSIPIITIGASTAALYYAMFKIVDNRDSGMIQMFFHSFRHNFKQGCVITLLFLVAGVFLYADIQACDLVEEQFRNIILTILVIMTILLVLVVSYTFPLLAQFENTIKITLKNAFLMSISNIRNTIIIVFLNLIPFGIYKILPNTFLMTIPIWLMVGVAAIALINAKIFVKIFDKYIENII